MDIELNRLNTVVRLDYDCLFYYHPRMLKYRFQINFYNVSVHSQFSSDT
jgi:hypothetical protein